MLMYMSNVEYKCLESGKGIYQLKIIFISRIKALSRVWVYQELWFVSRATGCIKELTDTWSKLWSKHQESEYVSRTCFKNWGKYLCVNTQPWARHMICWLCDLQYTTLAVYIIVNDNISSAHVNANLLSIICEKLSTLLIDWSKFNAFQLCVFELFAFRGSFTQSRTCAIFTSGWFLISTNSLCLRGFLVVNWYDFYADYLKGSRP